MGLDIALGLIVLSSAIRGWMRGFIVQAIRLGGLIGCVFAADPVRAQARPYLAPHLSSLRPELVDRLLWWGAALATYVLTTGISILVVKMYRRRTFGVEDQNRSDQFAGFLLGGIRGLVIAAFIVAGIQRFALDRVKGIDWAEEQTRTSHAMAWDAQYHPAERIWTAPPVQKFLAQIKEQGLKPIDASSVVPMLKGEETKDPVASAERPPRLEVPSPAAIDVKRDFDRLLKEIDNLKDR